MRGHGRFVWRAILCALMLGSAQAQFFTPSFQNYQTFAQRSVGYVAATVKPDFTAQAVTQALRPPATPVKYKYDLARTDFAFKGPPTQQSRCAQMATRPDDQRQMAALCLGLFQNMEALPEFHKHNVATALAVLIGVSLQVSQGLELGEAETDTLIRGLNDVLIDAQTMKGTRADLQATYESALMTAGLIVTLFQQGDETQDAQLSAAAKTLAQGVLLGFGVKP